jgi:hypothetical protein
MSAIIIAQAVKHALSSRSSGEAKPLLTTRAVRLEADLKTRPRRGGQAFQRVRGGPGPPALKACNNGLRRVHPSGELLLRQPGVSAGVDHSADKFKFRRERFVRLAVFRVFHPLPVEIVYLAHCSNSFARFNASSISRGGVFWVFFTNTRTTTKRLPMAGHIQRPRNPVTGLHTHFPKWAAQMFNMRLPHSFQPEFLHQPDDVNETGAHIYGGADNSATTTSFRVSTVHAIVDTTLYLFWYVVNKSCFHLGAGPLAYAKS